MVENVLFILYKSSKFVHLNRASCSQIPHLKGVTPSRQEMEEEEDEVGEEERKLKENKKF